MKSLRTIIPESNELLRHRAVSFNNLTDLTRLKKRWRAATGQNLLAKLTKPSRWRQMALQHDIGGVRIYGHNELLTTARQTAIGSPIRTIGAIGKQISAAGKVGMSEPNSNRINANAVPRQNKMARRPPANLLARNRTGPGFKAVGGRQRIKQGSWNNTKSQF